ncbi:hypothetical protein ACFE04_005159 [Oxalis oulophora]
MANSSQLKSDALIDQMKNQTPDAGKKLIEKIGLGAYITMLRVYDRSSRFYKRLSRPCAFTMQSLRYQFSINTLVVVLVPCLMVQDSISWSFWLLVAGCCAADLRH